MNLFKGKSLSNGKQPVTDDSALNEFLTRGVENVFPNIEAVKSSLKKGERLTVYLGVDPTGPNIHLGHVIPIRKLGQLQKLGHKIIFLIGDFTAMIGDPTDKTAARKQLTRAEVLNNCKKYKEQAGHFIDFSGYNKAEIRFNSKWLGKLSFEDVVKLASHTTVDQMLKRDMFEKRMSEGKPVYLHEFLYPLMQGYDSVAMDVDGEIGGNDQTFNMLAGRDLVKALSGKDKFVLTTKLLVDQSGKKMGKTEGNMVSLDQTSTDMFGKVMSWSDGLIATGFELLTDVPMNEIESMKEKMKNGSNPRDFKARLAEEIVANVYGREKSSQAREQFFSIFKEGAIPEDAAKTTAENGDKLVDVLLREKIVSSKGDFRRLVDGNAISYVGKNETVSDYDFKIEETGTVRVGKKRFITITISDTIIQ
jgi:tyrosyl-tRNA synthetase